MHIITNCLLEEVLEYSKTNSFLVPISMLPQDVSAKYQRKGNLEDLEQVGSTEKGCVDTDIVKKTG